MVRDIIGAKATAVAVAPQVRKITVDEGSEGQRLDNFLLRMLKGVPKTHVYRIIRSGEVRVNKGRASADTRIAAGDVIRLPPVRTSERAEQKIAAMAEQASPNIRLWLRAVMRKKLHMPRLRK